MVSPAALPAPNGLGAGGVGRRGARLLWSSLRTHPGPFAASIAGAVLFALMAVASTVVLGRVTDRVVLPTFGDGVDRSEVWLGAALIVGVAAARAVGVVARRLFGNVGTRRMQRTWFTRVTDRYLAVPLSWMRDQPAGRLLAHADADCERATMVLQPLPLSLGVVVIIAVATVQLVRVDPYVAAVGLAVFPSLAVVNHLYSRRVVAPAAAAQAALGAVSSVAHESFDGAMVVKALGLADREVARLAGAAEELRRQRLAVGRLRAAFEPALDALPNLGTVALLAVGAWRISAGAVSPGEVVQATALFGILTFPMRVMGFLLEELPRAVVAHERLAGVLAAPDRPRPARPRPLPGGPLEVVLDDVGFAYRDGPPVLAGLSARIAPGEVVALVGATGSGKSTLAALLAGLDRPTAGRLALGGVPVEEVEPAELAGAVALAFQEPHLFADTVRENLALGAPLTDDELRAALVLARADGFVSRLPRGLDQVLGERGVTLSGGQRQRLALARTLLRRPGLLVLDDATSAVDPVVEREILDGLRGAVRATTLIVAHRVGTIRLAGRVLYLDGGRIAAAGRHEDLLALPGYAELARAGEPDR
ncbi:MAG: ABC transporter ATP-binding protein [Acidimicrobiia bacterium]